jgi:hypothetical protein
MGARRLAVTVVAALMAATSCGAPDRPRIDVGSGFGGGSAGNTGSSGPAPPPVTWFDAVQPIVAKHCQGCHTAGGIAPFPLDDLAEAQKRHTLIAVTARARLMPPWMPDDACHPLIGNRRLTAGEILLIEEWSRQGATAGQARPPVMPPPPPPGLEWVDRELDAGVDYTPRPPAGKSDDYRCFLVDPALGEPAALVGYEIQPGVAGEVHHVVLFDATREAAEARDAAEDGPGWTCFGGPGTGSSRLLASWVPGSPITVHPGDTAIPLAPGAVMVMQVHYNTGGRTAVPDRTRVRLQFGRAPTRPAEMLPLVETTFRLPPRSSNVTTVATHQVRETRVLWGVQPHMHTLGRIIRLELVEPNGITSCLINIPRWQFHWQQLYFYEHPRGITLPAGSRVRLTCLWDNPEDRIVGWGEGTVDEMCAAVLYLTAP